MSLSQGKNLSPALFLLPVSLFNFRHFVNHCRNYKGEQSHLLLCSKRNVSLKGKIWNYLLRVYSIVDLTYSLQVTRPPMWVSFFCLLNIVSSEMPTTLSFFGRTSTPHPPTTDCRRVVSHSTPPSWPYFIGPGVGTYLKSIQQRCPWDFSNWNWESWRLLIMIPAQWRKPVWKDKAGRLKEA